MTLTTRLKALRKQAGEATPIGRGWTTVISLLKVKPVDEAHDYRKRFILARAVGEIGFSGGATPRPSAPQTDGE